MFGWHLVLQYRTFDTSVLQKKQTHKLFTYWYCDYSSESSFTSSVGGRLLRDETCSGNFSVLTWNFPLRRATDWLIKQIMFKIDLWREMNLPESSLHVFLWREKWVFFFKVLYQIE